jgi:hypothetical protein
VSFPLLPHLPILASSLLPVLALERVQPGELPVPASVGLQEGPGLPGVGAALLLLLEERSWE